MSKKIKFKDLRPGDQFVRLDCVWLKIQHAESRMNCARLDNGTCDSLDDYCAVEVAGQLYEAKEVKGDQVNYGTAQ